MAFAVRVLCALTACHFYAEEPPLGCTALKPGQTVEPNVGGDAPTRAKLTAALEYVAVADVTILELTTHCALIATDLGVSQDPLNTALAPISENDRMANACKLASDALARGHEPIVFSVVTCAPTPQPSCQKECAGACNDACNAAAAADAVCPEPPMTALHFGPILAKRARLAGMAPNAGALAASVEHVDIGAPCLAYPRDLVRAANVRVTLSQQAIEALITAAGGT